MNLFRRKKPIEVQAEKPNPDLMDAKTSDEYFNRGMLYYSQGEFEKSKKDFDQALSLDAGTVDANYGLALVYKASGDSDQAIEYFNRVIKLISEGALDDQPDRKNMLTNISKAQIASLTKDK